MHEDRARLAVGTGTLLVKGIVGEEAVAVAWRGVEEAAAAGDAEVVGGGDGEGVCWDHRVGEEGDVFEGDGGEGRVQE